MFLKKHNAVFVAILAFTALGLTVCAAEVNQAGPDQADKDMETALAKEGLSRQDVSDITSYYYLRPQPDKLVSLVKVLVSQNKFVTDAINFSVFAHFVAAAGHNDKYFLSELVDAEQDYLGLERVTVENLVSAAENFTSSSADSPQYLDFLWAEFFATGNEEPVKKIISLLAEENPKLSSAVVQREAESSLADNAAKHAKVVEVIRGESASARGALKEKLDNILNSPGLPADPGGE